MVADLLLIKRLEHGERKKIAEALGVPAPTVSNVINGWYRPRSEKGRKTQRRVQVAVARALKVKVEELFPATDGQAA